MSRGCSGSVCLQTVTFQPQATVATLNSLRGNDSLCLGQQRARRRQSCIFTSRKSKPFSKWGLAVYALYTIKWNHLQIIIGPTTVLGMQLPFDTWAGAQQRFIKTTALRAEHLELHRTREREVTCLYLDATDSNTRQQGLQETIWQADINADPFEGKSILIVALLHCLLQIKKKKCFFKKKGNIVF